MSAVPQALLAWSAMTADDLDEVHAVETLAYEFPWTVGNFRDSLLANYQCWVCRDAAPGGRVGPIVGYFVMLIGAGEAHLLNLCVAVPRQRRGYGRYLLEEALVLARAHGADTFILEVRPTNLPGIQLYAGAGFREIGRRRNYYPAHPVQGGHEDALVLERKLA